MREVIMKAENLATGLGTVTLVAMGTAIVSDKDEIQDRAIKVGLLSMLGLLALGLYQVNKL